MLKLLLATAPYLLKAPSQTSKKQIARSFMALVLFALSGFAFVAAAFIYITTFYGAAVGFLSVGAIFLILALVLYYKAKNPKKPTKSTLPVAATTDPIAGLLPESLMQDPVVTKIMKQITANPVATSLAAATIGMMITREIMKD